jgi:hypothetical protein
MSTQEHDQRRWKFFLWIGLVFFGIVTALAIANWPQAIKQGVAAGLGIDVVSDSEAGRPVFRITQISANSPFRQFNAQVGNTLVFDHFGDSRLQYSVGDAVGVTIGDGIAARHVVVRPTAQSYVDPQQRATYVLNMVNVVAALVLAGVIGLRRAASPSARLLALILMFESVYAFEYLPRGWLMDLTGVFHPLAVGIIYCAFLRFSQLLPNDESDHIPGWIRKASGFGALFFVAYVVLQAMDAYGWRAAPSFLETCKQFVVYALVGLSSYCLYRNYRASTGHTRQRLQWVAFCTGAKFLMYVVLNIPFALSFAGAFILIELVVMTLSNFGLAYGMLRHRLFDFGFAVNRTLVYSIVSAVLLVSFGLLEWLAHHFVSTEEAEKSVIVDGAIALGLYLVFHRLRHSVEHFVEKVFFHQWHENEARLRQFIKRAAHITAPEALIDAYLVALRDFTGGAACAVYRLDSVGYCRIADSGVQGPELVGIDDMLAVGLRAELAPLCPADSRSALPGALALPMSFRGDLQGFVLIGEKVNQSDYRPDELAVLEDSAQNVGMDLHVLQVERLHSEVAGLRNEITVLNKLLGPNQAAQPANAEEAGTRLLYPS